MSELVLEGRRIDRIEVKHPQLPFHIPNPTQEQWDALMKLGYEVTDKGVHTVITSV